MASSLERLASALADRYRIERELGAGGMATVYLAADLKHDRKVAIKVLKPELAAVLGAERFVQEIKTTAALSHPHILPLFDSGEAGGFLYYVMPYLQGETIREKLNRETQFGIDEAVRIATDVADALDYAHQNGVIHRDIKPENILLHNGRPMVMDFGIALAVSAAAGGRMTETGLSLGTPHYMSPEQATADKEITARSDVYSLASVLYEMLAGVPPHEGGSAQQVIMRIIADTPRPVTDLRRSVPPNVAAALGKALEKLPADRFDSAKAFADALGNPAYLPQATGWLPAGGQPQRWKHVAIAASAAAVVFLATSIAGWLRTPHEDPAPSVRFSEPLDSARFSVADALNSLDRIIAIDVSRDGRTILLHDNRFRNWARRLDREEFVQLAQGANPRLSPDGSTLAFVNRSGALQTQSVPGGPSVLIDNIRNAAANANPNIAWGDDGYLYVESPQSESTDDAFILLRYRADGPGLPDTLRLTPKIGAVNKSQARAVPQVLLPGSRVLVYSVLASGGGAPTLWAQAIGGDEAFALGPSASARSAMWDDEHDRLLLERGESLLAWQLDLRTGEPNGQPVALTGLGSSALVGFGGGTLAMVNGQGGTRRLLLADRQGNTRPLPGLRDDSLVSAPAVSPDGRRVALSMGSAGDLFVYELPAGPLVQVTRDGAGAMAWMPDGQSLLFVRGTEIYRVRADGDQQPELVLSRPQALTRVTVDAGGEQVYFQALGNNWDIGTFTLGVPGSDTLILNTTGQQGHPSVSPDGQWLAYYAESMGQQVFIRPTTGTGQRVQVSRQSATYPRFSKDGRRLYFIQNQGGRVFSATLERTADGSLRPARIDSLPLLVSDRGFDAFPGDSLFVFVTNRLNENTTTAQSLTVITNFARSLSPQDGR